MVVETENARVQPMPTWRAWQVMRYSPANKKRWREANVFDSGLGRALAHAADLPCVGVDERLELGLASDRVVAAMSRTSARDLPKGMPLGWRGLRAVPKSAGDGVTYWQVERRGASGGWSDFGHYPTSSPRLLWALLEFEMKAMDGTHTPAEAVGVAEDVARSLGEVVDDARA